MALPKVQEVRELSEEDLQKQILAVKKQLFELRFKQGTRQTVKPHEFKHAKHQLAQLMTVERERQSRSQS
ncbi:MAG: 50S ribosomal protein L29 [Pseudanabaena sp. ELA607]|jgi:large subunit ribosomal protein L29